MRFQTTQLQKTNRDLCRTVDEWRVTAACLVSSLELSHDVLISVSGLEECPNICPICELIRQTKEKLTA